MKPTFQISRPSRPSDASRPLDFYSSKSPATDWSFQSPATHLRGGATLLPGARRLAGPGFHTLSQGFFSGEANRESRFEGVLFGVIAALATWPIVLAVQAASVLLR